MASQQAAFKSVLIYVTPYQWTLNRLVFKSVLIYVTPYQWTLSRLIFKTVIIYVTLHQWPLNRLGFHQRFHCIGFFVLVDVLNPRSSAYKFDSLAVF